MRVSQGSNDSQPVTSRYTSFRDRRRPRSGASSKRHSPAWKQYPKSMNTAWYRRSRWRLVKTAWRPLALPVHLSYASMLANSSRFFGFADLRFGQKIHHLPRHHAPGKARSKLQAPAWQRTRVRPRSIFQLRRSCRSASLKPPPVRHRHQAVLLPPGQPRSHQFIGQHPRMLRDCSWNFTTYTYWPSAPSINWLLRAAPHAPDLLHRQNRHSAPPHSCRSLSRDSLTNSNAAFGVARGILRPRMPPPAHSPPTLLRQNRLPN